MHVAGYAKLPRQREQIPYFDSTYKAAVLKGFLAFGPVYGFPQFQEENNVPPPGTASSNLVLHASVL